MTLNITHTMNSFQFENRENLRNAARNILNKQVARGVAFLAIEHSCRSSSHYHRSRSYYGLLRNSGELDLFANGLGRISRGFRYAELR